LAWGDSPATADPDNAAITGAVHELVTSRMMLSAAEAEGNAEKAAVAKAQNRAALDRLYDIRRTIR
jgi:hypothetical protein